MMKVFRIIIAVVLLFKIHSSQPSFAEEKISFYDRLQRHTDQYKSNFKEPYTMTTWAALKLAQKSKDVFGTIDHESTFAVPILHGLSKTADFIHPTYVVYIPGIFTGVHNSRAKRHVNDFMRYGVNVIYVANPWSTDFLTHGPKVLPGDFEKEAEIIYNTVLRFIKSKKLHGTFYLFGESYGAFISSIVSYQDTLREKLFEPLTILVSPPLNISDSFLRLDMAMEEQVPTYNQTSWWAMYFALRQLNHLDPEDEIADSNEIYGVAPMFFSIFGLNNNLRRSLLCINDKRPELFDHRFDLKKSQWTRENLRFQRYVDVVLKEKANLHYELEKFNLRHWTSLGVGAGREMVVVLASDDPINDPHGLEEFILSGNSQVFTLGETGGHSGFIATNWYQSFLKEVVEHGYKNNW